jgi:predicted PurR-regulated permease PerM
MFNEPVNGRRIFFGVVSVVAVVAILYFGREVLVPLAIAIMLTFLLSPICEWLERRGVWRVAAVLITMCSVSAIFAVVGWIVGLQMIDLATRLPTYKGNLIAKLQSVRPSSGGTLTKVWSTVNEVRGVFDKKTGEQPEEEDGTKAGSTAIPPPKGEVVTRPNSLENSIDRAVAKRPAPSLQNVPTIEEGMERIAENTEVITPVRIVPDDAVPFETLRSVLTTVAAPFANLAIVFVLVIFMLMSREDLRNRMVRLAGNRLALTTRTLDEVGQRISRYLLMNGLVNGGFGLCVALGLKVIGVEYALTWGLLAAVLRFLPYIGPIVAASLPISMAFIQFPGNDWIHPLATLGLFLVLELVCNNVIEPLAYGHGTGVSTVAILISALFWGWIWGPIGLMLAVPITVVLAVVGTHVPMFETLGIMLGDRPALASWITYYQRLLAGDVDEAESIVQEQRKTLPLDTVYDEVIVRALVLVEKDHDSGELSDDQRSFILNSTRQLVQELDEEAEKGRIGLSQSASAEERAGDGDGDADAALSISPSHADPDNSRSVVVLGCCAKDDSDELCLLMLRQLLTEKLAAFDFVSAGTLSSDVVGRVEAEKPDLVIISSQAPNGGAETRYLCKKLRKQFPTLKILVGRWGCTTEKRDTQARMKACGADATAISLVEGRELVQKLADEIEAEFVLPQPRIAVGT